MILISETHFRIFKIFRYEIYHTTHPDGTAHGVAAVTISHNELLCYKTPKIQETNIQIQEQQRPFVISALYCSPRHAISIEEYKTSFRSLGTKFMAGGDWNAKHTERGPRLISPKGRNLLQAMNRMNCSHLSTGNHIGIQNSMKHLICWTFFICSRYFK